MMINFENKKLKIDNGVLRNIFNRIQLDECDCEAGGMLIGSIVRNSKDIIIEDLTLPISGDSCTRIKFVRSDKHNEILEKKWVESQCTKMYFGEWHTHPQKVPIPSKTDISNWKKLMKLSNTETELLLFIIAGTTYFKIWVGNRKRMNICLIFEGGYTEFPMD